MKYVFMEEEMYDDLLGPRKEKQITQVVKGSSIRNQKIIFQCDIRTPSGRLYPRATMDVALTIALKQVSGFYLVSGGTPKDPMVVELSNIIGSVKSYSIHHNGEVWFDIKYLNPKLMEAYGELPISPCCVGNVDKNLVVMKTLIITQLYVI